MKESIETGKTEMRGEERDRRGEKIRLSILLTIVHGILLSILLLVEIHTTGGAK